MSLLLLDLATSSRHRAARIDIELGFEVFQVTGGRNDAIVSRLRMGSVSWASSHRRRGRFGASGFAPSTRISDDGFKEQRPMMTNPPPAHRTEAWSPRLSDLAMARGIRVTVDEA
jgi:hypothetical protein